MNVFLYKNKRLLSFINKQGGCIFKAEENAVQKPGFCDFFCARVFSFIVFY